MSSGVHGQRGWAGGAEIPKAAPAAGGAADISMDYKRFWRELGETLGMQPGIHMPKNYEPTGMALRLPQATRLPDSMYHAR